MESRCVLRFLIYQSYRRANVVMAAKGIEWLSRRVFLVVGLRVTLVALGGTILVESCVGGDPLQFFAQTLVAQVLMLSSSRPRRITVRETTRSTFALKKL